VIAWLTPIELSSAIWRKWRENGDDAVRIRAERRVRSIAKASVLVDDIRAVTRHAQDLFERNPLKAADAAQLASALVAAGLLGQMPLVTLDHTLANAARNEGLAVIGRSPTS